MAVSKPKKRVQEDLELTSRKTEWQVLLEYVERNPLISAAVAAFLLLCVLAGLIYRGGAGARDQRVTTEYAQAVVTEDPALRATQLAPVAESTSRWTAEALYMMGEAAFHAKEYSKAKAAYERTRAEFPSAAFTPDAVEGLGYIAENEGDYEAAVTLYREVLSKWPESFAAMRQEFNIGRCQERLGNFPEAVQSYTAQTTLFPDSGVSVEAETALERLRVTHPDLFPKVDTEAQAATAEPSQEAAQPAAPGALPALIVDQSEPAFPEETPPAENVSSPDAEPGVASDDDPGDTASPEREDGE